ncbi:MAG TPA: non-canonical purine NTP pyrophosphatase [Gemmatimonadaceae bacterium]|nr:non-canonical purine NTP pyrophosphatase [Gemmatimonadaceae bacterium]
MSSDPWIVATRNRGKLRELRALFGEAGIDVIDLDQAGIDERPEEEESVEVHDTFEGNALAKARYYGRRAGGRPVVADDSGLEVAALGGEPGVRSKRWSGRLDLEGAALDAANNRLLIGRLEADADRRARFVCAVAWTAGADVESAAKADADAVAEVHAVVVRGEVEGTIVARGVGDAGFGYDPHFFVPELGCTLGQATEEEKQRVSHRARAIAALLEVLDSRGLLARRRG